MARGIGIRTKEEWERHGWFSVWTLLILKWSNIVRNASGKTRICNVKMVETSVYMHMMKTKKGKDPPRTQPNYWRAENKF
jgi:hypothetical protein